MASLPKTESDLEIIGTARQPNISDLRERGLIGLSDPDPETLIRRAKHESEQASLKTRVKIHKSEIPVSFLRTKIDTQESDHDTAGSDWEKGESGRAGEVDVGRAKENEKTPTLAPCVGMLSPLDSAVANEACGPEQADYSLRHRSAVQLRPYAVEREMYRQMIATGKVKV